MAEYFVYSSPMRLFFLLIIVLLPVQAADAANIFPKKHYQETWCNAFNGRMDVVMEDGGLADCITEKYAVEVDFAPNWKEAVAQSVLYAIMTKKKPAVVLIVENPETELRYLERLKKVTGHLDIMMWWVSPTDGVQIYEPFVR
jgi:hypothetical protein